MKHRLKGKKLNRTSSHRKALLKNLSQALIKHEQIMTTLVKAKTLKPFEVKNLHNAFPIKPLLPVIKKVSLLISLIYII